MKGKRGYPAVLRYAMMFCVIFCLCVLGGCSGSENNVKETKTPVAKTKTPKKGEIVTDSTEIIAMAGSIVEKMTLEEKIGQMFVVHLEQLDKSEGGYFEFRQFTNNMADTLKKYPVGGIILFARNIEAIDQTKTLIEEAQKNTKVPLFIAVDEEGGSVARIGNNSNMHTTSFPVMEEIGAMNDEDYVYNMGVTIGKEIKELGFNLDFAPVADVKTNEYNTEIGDRAFGSDAKLVSKMVKQVVNGLQAQNISATLKHFPGHGSVSGDSHTSPVNADTDLLGLRSTEFKPFQAGIDAGVDFVMISHISISKVTENTVPATMSKLVIQNMLRQELGFSGIIITDAMDMGAITKKYKPGDAAVKAIQAGIDIVLMTPDLEEAYQAVYDAVKAGEITEKQITESVQRIIETKIRRGIILSNTDLL
ncbi:MAG: glycoside hydrolase family 3 protein [Lachnospiraceae bacterium]|nr:glycoside hydrolase family 3 protein [Lachnospiraceae bacterium]